MATLEKIRNRSGLLVAILAVALGLFVLQSALESGGSLFSADRDVVGEINGRKVKYDEFNARVDQAIENEKARTQSMVVDEATTDMLRQQVWNQMINETIMDSEYEKAGVAVSTEELYDMVSGPNPHPSVKQAFTDPKTGQFSPSNVINFLKNLDQDPATKQRWLSFEEAIKKERLAQKYNILISKGLYITKGHAEHETAVNSKTLTMKYALKRYDSVADSTIKVTDSEISKVYNENKNRYKQEKSRAIEFVVWDVLPSADDRQAAQEDITKLAEEFKASTDDSAFVNSVSESKYTGQFFAKGSFNPSVDSLIFSSPEGTVLGPYLEGESFKVYKVSKIKMMPDSVKARHILLKGENGNNTKALAKADSLKKLIKSGQKFDELARTVSEDVGSAVKGGDLGWFREGMMVKPFNDASFNGKVGDMPIVESQFGVHLIEILDKGPEVKKALVNVIDLNVNPSTKTFQSYYAKASEFAGKNTNADEFHKAIVDQNLNKRIADNVKDIDRNVPGVEGARELVRWSFEAEKGDVSKVFEFGDKYVVALVTEIKEKGIAPLEQVRENVETLAREQKKAERFIELAKGSSTVDQAAGKFGTQAQSTENVSFGSATIPGLAREPEIVGAAYGMKKGAVSQPTKGTLGVYVFTVTEVNESGAPKDLASAKAQLANTYKSRVDYELFEALKEKAEINDNRAKFF